MSKQVLYKVIKIKTSKIHNKTVKVRNQKNKLVKKEPVEYNLGEYTFKSALSNGDVVSVGDNLVFHKIRDFYNDNKTPKEIYDDIQRLYKEREKIKKLNTNKENIEKLKIIQNNINEIQYIKDIVNVKVTNKDHYRDIALNGFTMNGIKYKRLCCGSGQMRRNTVTFVNEKLYDYLNESLMCGLDGRIEKISLAKYSAYFALSFSSVLWVRKPRICVIPDYETVLPNQKIDFVVKDENGKKHIEEREMDITLNSADGMGLISPQCAKWFSEDIGLPEGQVACQFVIRSVFVKGCLNTFDFTEYARVTTGNTKIKSIYGEEFDLNDVDVLLTVSMFKMNKYFNSVKEYIDYHEKYNLKWGIARYNKIIEDRYSLLNYQYIQNNNLSDKDLEELIKPTIDWFKKICSGNDVYSLLYTLGCRSQDEKYSDILNDCGSLFSKVILHNSGMLNDGYIKKKIYNSIKESFRKAKIGRIWCHGNYEFMVSDPIPLIRNALGLSPTGLIPANHVYSNYWNKYSPEQIDLMRSPMVDRHEHNVVNLANTSEMQNWYKYLYSGIIYSIYDTSTIRHSDSDFDGDLVFSTDNPILINGAYKDNNPITYDKPTAPQQELTYENVVLCDLNGFDTLIGQITNNSTSITAMLPLFPPDKYSEQHNELIHRLKLLREIIGSEIDKIKLGVSPNFPKEWVERIHINEEDDDITKAFKYKHNSLVINKKAYFMIYIYPNLLRSYQNHTRQFDLDCKNKYGLTYYNLKYLKNKTKSQYKFLKRMDYFSPVLDTQCTMNKLCHVFERLEREISYNKELGQSYLPRFNKCNFEIDSDKLGNLNILYKQYMSQRQFSYLKHIIEEVLPDDDFQETIADMISILNNEFSNKCYEEISNSSELFEYLLSVSELYTSNNKTFDYSFIWSVLGDDILNVIPRNSKIAIPDEEGVEYLGNKYKIVGLTNDNLE